MKPFLLIDGDQFIHKACAAIERDVRWDDENHVLTANEEEAWDGLQAMFKRIFQRFDTDSCIVTISAPPNFRLKIDATYKAHRVQRKPLCYAAIKERVSEHYNVVSFPTLEADDVMGIFATMPGTAKVGPKEGRIIVSQDKDMKTIPATIWDGKELVTYSEDEADYWHLYQTLIGDSSDGYKGCPGVGPKKAEGLLVGALSGEHDADADLSKLQWQAVVGAFKKAGLTEEDALVQARLARILRWSDWNNKSKEPKLWQP